MNNVVSYNYINNINNLLFLSKTTCFKIYLTAVKYYKLISNINRHFPALVVPLWMGWGGITIDHSGTWLERKSRRYEYLSEVYEHVDSFVGVAAFLCEAKLFVDGVVVIITPHHRIVLSGTLFRQQSGVKGHSLGSKAKTLSFTFMSFTHRLIVLMSRFFFCTFKCRLVISWRDSSWFRSTCGS